MHKYFISFTLIYPANSSTYYAFADYKSFIEQAGGGAVPLFINQPSSYYEKIIPRLNGVLFPGGDADLVTSPYAKVGEIVYRSVNADFTTWATTYL